MGGHRCCTPPGRRRRSGAGRPCRRPGRRTGPSRPGEEAVIAAAGTTQMRHALLRGGCRRRGRCAGPSRRRGRAGCRRGCGTGRAGRGRTPPTAASRPTARARSRRRPLVAPPVLGRVGGGRLPHPGALVVGRAAVLHALAVARPVALDDLAEARPSRSGRSRSGRVSSFQRRSGSGRVRPRTSAWGTHMSTNRWRSSSLVWRLIFQAIDWAVWADCVVGRAEHHQRRPPPAVDRVLGHGVLGLGAPAEGVAGSRSPGAGGRTPPCRCGSSPGRTGRRSSGTAAPGS